MVLGRVQYRTDDRTFGLTPEDRRRHLYVVGRTGVGKTTLLENLIRSDIAAGRGVCLIDPHGDLAETIIASIPSERTNDVIVFDPADPLQAIAFNPLSCRPGWEDRVTSGVVTSFKASGSWRLTSRPEQGFALFRQQSDAWLMPELRRLVPAYNCHHGSW